MSSPLGAANGASKLMRWMAAVVSAVALAGQSAAAALAIDARSVAGLQLAFSLPLGSVGAEANAPASADGLLYVLTSFPHTLWTIDPAAAADGRIRWRHAPTADLAAQGHACCDRSRHGPVMADGRLFFTTLDGHVVALDAQSGVPRFDTRLTDLQSGETLAGAPLVADGKVFVGNAGDEAGVRGWLAALDAGSGKLLWKRYSVGPDADVGIVPAFKPFYDELKAADLGTRSWPPSGWEHGGGSVAGSLLFDRRAGAILHETGRPAPWNPQQRPGDNRWTTGVFARDAATGSARWFTGFNAGDPYGYGNAGNDLLMTSVWQGEPRELLVHPDANGVLYVLDRSTGQILAADSVVPTVVSRVDLATGRSHYAPSKTVKTNEQTREVCPAWTGAFGSGASAVGDTSIVALPVSRMCMDIEARPANYVKGTPYAGANVRLLLGRAGGGALIGWDVSRRQPAWRIVEPWPVLGGTLATEGGLVFYGTLDGAFKALDGRSGKLLWQFKAGQGIVSRPVAFQGRDGRPYVAVVAGTRQLYGMSRAEALDPRDETAGFGWAGALRRLPQDSDTGSQLLVFRLP